MARLRFHFRVNMEGQSEHRRLSRISKLWIEEPPRMLIIIVLALITTVILRGPAITFLAEVHNHRGGCFSPLPANTSC